VTAGVKALFSSVWARFAAVGEGAVAGRFTTEISDKAQYYIAETMRWQARIVVEEGSRRLIVGGWGEGGICGH
jgi:hypothetical protein